MIVDAHTHIFPDAIAQRAISTLAERAKGQVEAYAQGTYDDLIRSMDEAGIDYSVVLPIATQPQQGFGILRWIEQMMKRSSRLIFFCSVHPQDPQWKELIREAKTLGLQGIKFHPIYQEFAVDAAEVRKVYEEALKNDLVLYFHAGPDLSLPESDFASVVRFASFLQDFDSSKVVLAHAGGYGEWDQVLELLGDRKCYYDSAFVLEAMKQDAHARELYRRNEDRFLFGTDSPWQSQKRYVELIRDSVILNHQQKEKLLHGNLQKLIKLPAA